jgi:uncharacterized protein (UPF0216 family)
MSDKLTSERMLQEYLGDELRVINAHLPLKQKPLSDLLHEEYPHVVCNDGSTHLFKRRELEYIASLIDIDEQQVLLLPMLVEPSAEQGEATIILIEGEEVEEKVISKILGMPVTRKQTGITIYRPQLAVLRTKLKTTTQYVFSRARY